MRFLFREEEAYPRHWIIKEDIIEAYFEIHKFRMTEPWFEPDEPITKAYFETAIDYLEQAGVL